MGENLLKYIGSGLRWLCWGVKYGVVWPLATMMLLIVGVFWLGPVTAGQTLVMESVQHEGYVIRDCTGSAPAGKLNGDEVKPLLPSPPVMQEDCVAVSTDMAGYAEYIDAQLLKVGRALWLLLAVLFTTSAWACGLTPINRNITASRKIMYGMKFTEGRPGRGSSSLIRSVCHKHRTDTFYFQPAEKNNGADSENK